MSVLLLIRHGDTDYLGNRLAGRTPGVFLNEFGCQQANGLAQALRGLSVSAIYSSPLERTLQTARPLALLQHLPVQVEPGLVELDYGAFQGQTFEFLRSQDIWKRVHSSPAQVRFPGGELLAEAQARAAQTLVKIARQVDQHALVACFTHGDMIRLALAAFLDIPLDAYQRLDIRTASVSVVQIEESKIRVPQINHRPGESVFVPISAPS